MTQAPKRNLLQAALIACFLAPLVVQAYVGQFSRYLADDYCTAGRALSTGVVASALWWYNNWAGQFTNWTAKGIAGVVGIGSASVFPALIIILWVAALTWTLYQLFALISLRLSLPVVLLLAVVIIFAVFDGIPSVIQSLYWIGASIPYTSPLILLTFFIGFFLRTLRNGRVSPVALVISAVISFIAAGLSEVYAAFQTTVFLLILLGVLLRAPAPLKRSALVILLVGLVCTVIAMVIIITAPGNAVRQSAFTPSSSLPVLILRTITVSASYMVLAIGVLSPLALLAAVVVPAFVAFQFFPPISFRLTARRIRGLLALSAGIAWVLIMASLGPVLYALSTPPSGRVYIMPQLVLVLTAVFWGCLMGLSARQNNLRLAPRQRAVGMAALAALLVIGPIASAFSALREGAQFSEYAAGWDYQDSEIRSAVANGERDVGVVALTTNIVEINRLGILGPDPQDWVNRCATIYYRVDSISARTPLQMGDK
jgi:hypothetical protein